MTALSIDALIGNDAEFPVIRRWRFFNHAGVCPLPHRTAAAMNAYAAHAETDAYLRADWYARIEALRELAARLINASPGEIAFVKNTSEGLATVANGLDWRAGDRIVTTAVEYPANMYPWMDISRRFNLELIAIPERRHHDGTVSVPLGDVLREISHPRTRLVALSHVEFASGQRHDLATIGRSCRQHGALFCVDAIQSLGALPLDVRQMNIDFLSADGHKWLLGPEGAGIFYCRRELLAQLRPLIIGWMNVARAEDYGHYDLTLKDDARRFECGTHNVAGLLGLKASVELLLTAGIDAVSRRIKLLTDRLASGLRDKGYQVLSPRTGESWSGIISFTTLVHDHAALVRDLRKAHSIEIALRVGRLRASPHFYNTEAEIDMLIDRLPHCGIA